MATRTDASLAALLLCQRLVDMPVASLRSSEYWALLDAVDDPAALLGLDAAAITRAAGVDAGMADRLAPLLYVVGDPALLRADLLGIVGSRDVVEAAAQVARAAAAAAAAQRYGVVSGAAKGVDRLALSASLDAGGSAVGVLADSLTRMTRDPEVRQAANDEHLCLCTPYKPTAGFSVANAMGRNKLIYALSKATLVVAADATKGGTWAGATEAIRQSTAPVVVWTGEGAGHGNALLAERGATALNQLSDLFPLPDPAPRASEEQPDQLALEV